MKVGDVLEEVEVDRALQPTHTACLRRADPEIEKDGSRTRELNRRAVVRDGK
jgi:hypothetical protein